MQEQQNQPVEQHFTVTIKPISDAGQRKSLQEALDRIHDMNKNLEYFYTTIASGYGQARTLFGELESQGLVRKEPALDRTDRSVVTYLDLLVAIRNEIEREREILEEIKAAEQEKEIHVVEQAPEDFGLFFDQKVRNAKVQVKKIESSLRVSFSRYQHWIQHTLVRLNDIQKVHGVRKTD